MSSTSQRTRRHSLRRLLPVAVVAATTALALTGCEPGVLAPTTTPGAPMSSAPATTTAPSTSPPTTAPATAEPAASASPTAEPTTPPVAGDLACSEIYTLDQLYTFDANYAPSSTAGELPGAIAAIEAAGGTVCAYQHVTNDERLLVAVAQDATGLTSASFETVGDEGVAVATSGAAVAAVASIYFTTESEAQPVLDEVLSNLG